ncbi:ABC transporter permease [Fundidesulfovibrio butyratiphilus]
MRIVIEAAPPAGLIATLGQTLRLADPFRLVRSLWSRRELLREFTRLEFSGRYQGTHLGLAWGLITPLVTLAVYTFVFAYVLKASWSGAGSAGGMLGYALALFTGLACFEALSGAASRGAQLMSENVNFVKKVVFPLEVLPVSVALALVLQSALSLCLVVAARLCIGETPGMAALLAPLGFVPLVLLAAGLGLWLAPVGVAARDAGQMVGVFMQLYFFLTPIVYPLSAVPERYRFLLALNPLYPVIDHFRRTLLFDQPPDWTGLGLVTLFALVFFLLGYAWFMQLKKVFADVL